MVSWEELRSRFFGVCASVVLAVGSVVAIGWDPIFEYEGKTYAEMDKAEKVGRIFF